MAEIESLIQGSDKLKSVFGYWPSFHDAEVIEIHFWRGDIDTDNSKYVFPILTAKLLPAQTVDATPFNQLIRHYFPVENRFVRLNSTKP